MTKNKTTRELAYEALLAVDRDGMQSHIVIQKYLPQLPERDRAFFLRLAEGTVEYRLQLDYVINRFSKTRTAKMRPGIREILRMAVYQILYMDSVPDRAAVNEAVGLAVSKGFGGLRGFVNGVLRAVVRGKPYQEDFWPGREKDPVKALSVRYSISEEIVAAWLPRYGMEKTEAVCRAFLEERPLTAHCFTAPGASDNGPEPTGEGCTEPASVNWLEPTGVLPNSYFIRKGTDPAGTPLFREGKLYVQDLSSQIAVAAADIQPGDRVLDLCAAPGGKSLLAAEKGACVLARDLTEEKTALIRENAERTHLYAMETGKAAEATVQGSPGISVMTADASVFDPDLEEKFDVVIADLPCSGFGVAGRKPEIKYKAYAETVNALSRIQRTILANAVRYVRPGGKLLYSTCTIAVEENEDNVQWLLETYPCLKPASQPVEGSRLADSLQPVCKGGTQLLPCDGPWDGFFFALFEKLSD